MIRMTRKSIAWAIAALLGLIAGAQAFGQTAGQASSGWQVEITPYAWLVGIKGDLQAGGKSASIGVSFSDILNSLDFGLMGVLNVRKGRVGFVFDGLYSRLTKDGTTSGSTEPNVHAKIVSQIYALGAFYRVNDGRVPIDIGAGVRVMPMSASVTVTSGVLEGWEVSGDNTALDGFVAVRFVAPLSGRLAIDGYADIGAGDSKFTWQAMGGLAYRLSGSLSLKLGYRYLNIHNEAPDLSTTIGEGGFYIGLGIRL